MSYTFESELDTICKKWQSSLADSFADCKIKISGNNIGNVMDALNGLLDKNKHLHQIIDNQIPVIETLQQEIIELRLQVKKIGFWKSTSMLGAVCFIISMVLYFWRIVEPLPYS